MQIDPESIILEKGNWVAYKSDISTHNFCVARKNKPSNYIVRVAFPRLDMYYENDAKELVKLLAQLEKMAISSLKQIKRESAAFRIAATVNSYRTPTP